jgi:hypothetical protein
MVRYFSRLATASTAALPQTSSGSVCEPLTPTAPIFFPPSEIVFQMITTRSTRITFRAVIGEALYIPGNGMISTISIHAPGICRWGWSLPNNFVAASCELACTTE